MSDTIRPDISIYQHAIAIAKQVYLLTSILPVEQRFVLTSQLRRSIILVCNSLSNMAASDSKIALKRNSEQFISVYAEIKTQIKISITLGCFSNNELEDLAYSLENILSFCNSNLASFNRN